MQEELLGYVLINHWQLDPINLVTCVYRLARMSINLPNLEQRITWRNELIGSFAFDQLLGEIA
jgi:hypothetical protein